MTFLRQEITFKYDDYDYLKDLAVELEKIVKNSRKSAINYFGDKSEENLTKLLEALDLL